MTDVGLCSLADGCPLLQELDLGWWCVSCGQDKDFEESANVKQHSLPKNVSDCTV